MHIQAAINGGRPKTDHKNIPVTLEEMVQDVIAAVHAGASSIHLHPRNHAGRETLDPKVISATLKEIRKAVEVPVGISTGEWIEPEPHKRLDMISQWEELPDFASVNIHEEEALSIIDLLMSKGVNIEAGIWTLDSARKLVDNNLAPKCLRILVEPMEETLPVAKENFLAILAFLKQQGIHLPVLLHGQESTSWPVLQWALSHGLQTRIGFEDTLFLPDGNIAESNEQLIRTAYQLIKSSAL